MAAVEVERSAVGRPDSFFDDHPTFKTTLYPVMKEINHLSQGIGEYMMDIFYRVCSEPRLKDAMEKQPFFEFALISELNELAGQAKESIARIETEFRTKCNTNLQQLMAMLDSTYNSEAHFTRLFGDRVQPWVNRQSDIRQEANRRDMESTLLRLEWQPLDDVDDDDVDS